MDEPGAAFERVFRAHWDPVCRYLARRIPRDDVEEVASAVFTAAFEKRAQCPPEPLPWLYRFAHHYVLRHRRSQWVRGDLVRRLAGQRHPEVVAAPGNEEADKGLSARAEALLARVGPRDAELLRLIAWEQLTIHEAAEVLGCTPNAASIRLHRIRQLARISDAESTSPTPMRPS